MMAVVMGDCSVLVIVCIVAIIGRVFYIHANMEIILTIMDGALYQFSK